jgi:hypothetical protein
MAAGGVITRTDISFGGLMPRLFQRITTQWCALAVHKKGKEEKRTS